MDDFDRDLVIVVLFNVREPIVFMLLVMKLSENVQDFEEEIDIVDDIFVTMVSDRIPLYDEVSEICSERLLIID